MSATVRTVAATLATVAAVVLVEFALVGPDEIARLTPADFLRIPVDGLVAAAVVLALPGPARLLTAAAIGVLLGLLTVLKIVDMGFYVFLDRPFNPTSDWSYFRSASDLLSLALGRRDANVFVVAAVVLATLVMVFVPLSVLWLTRVASRHRTASLRLLAALGAVSLVAAAIGVRVGSSQAIASTDAAGLLFDEVHQIRAGFDDRQTLMREAADDPFRTTPRADLLTRLRGKDVVIAFVESYGKVAVQGSSFSPRVDALLRNGSRSLQAAGFASRSAFLTSPTFGGISWLAHSTLQSGLWIDNQHTYDDLVRTPRFTLSDAFKRAGWRTVADVPSNEKDWPEGRSFYHYDQIYDDHNVGYHGPSFSYASMPDQYTLSALQRRELAPPDRPPVMAEVDLVSSHIPWAPLPRMVDWRKVGDGSIFDAMPAQGQSPTWVWRSADRVRAAYGHSVEYSLRSLMSFVRTYPDKNLVLIVLGDHQPSTMVTGQGQSHDVPVSVIAHDPAVMRSISGWRWQSGMLPGADAPVWPMSSFRDRFLTAFDARH
ncbi:MAG: hypothetical protein QOD35_944 [Nocardioidaceae bacterium]|nr:hypothetical protein [Nocardioidaceae bacterium]